MWLILVNLRVGAILKAFLVNGLLGHLGNDGLPFTGCLFTGPHGPSSQPVPSSCPVTRGQLQYPVRDGKILDTPRVATVGIAEGEMAVSQPAELKLRTPAWSTLDFHGASWFQDPFVLPYSALAAALLRFERARPNVRRAPSSINTGIWSGRHPAPCWRVCGHKIVR